MYVKNVALKNVRGFGDGPSQANISFTRSDGTHAGWTVIAGRNGAGKTTFLRSIALAVVGPRIVRTLQESFAGWIREGASRASATAILHISKAERSTKYTPPSDYFTARVIWEDPVSGTEPTVGAAGTSGGRNTRGPEFGPWADEPEGWFIAGYGPFRRLTGHASDAQRLMSGPKRIARLVSLFREDASLVESVQWLKDVYTRRLEGRPGTAELEDSVLKLLGDGLLPEGMKINRIDSDGLWVERGNLLLPLHDLSDGYRTMSALVLDLVRNLYDSFGEFIVSRPNGHWIAPYEGVVLIDEIDVHLHVSWQQRVGFWLKEHFPKIQFIVTTHSPFICQAADPKGLIRLPGPGESRPAEHVSDELYATVVNGGADEAVMTELFGLDHAYSRESERMRERVAALEVKEIRTRLSAKEQSELAKLRGRLPRTGSALVEQALRKVKAER